MLDYPNPTLIPLNGVVSLIACEATNLELLRKQEASERQLLEWKQDQLSETVALRGRLEEPGGTDPN
eukprot:g1185.t1